MKAKQTTPGSQEFLMCIWTLLRQTRWMSETITRPRKSEMHDKESNTQEKEADFQK